MSTANTAQAPHSELFFTFGDKRGQAQFVMWHHLRHVTYDRLASQKGVSLTAMDLTGDIDDDWFQRHAVRHATHRQLLGVTAGTFNVLPHVHSHVEWHNPGRRSDFLQAHAAEHALLDALYGIT